MATLTEQRSTSSRPEVVVRVDQKRSRRPSLLSLLALILLAWAAFRDELERVLPDAAIGLFGRSDAKKYDYSI